VVDGASDTVLLRVPASLFDDDLLSETRSAFRVRSFRRGTPNEVVTLIVGGIAVTSNLVTIAVARDQLADLAKGLWRRVCREAPDASTHLVELTRGETTLSLTDVRSEDLTRLVVTILELRSEAAELGDGPRRATHHNADTGDN
jgi:hypothetical protein